MNIQQLTALIKKIMIETINELQAPAKPTTSKTVSKPSVNKTVSKASKPSVKKTAVKAPAKPKVDTPYQLSYTQGKKAGQVKKISLETLTKKLETYKDYHKLTTFLVNDAVASINSGEQFDASYPKTSYSITSIKQNKKPIRKATKQQKGKNQVEGCI